MMNRKQRKFRTAVYLLAAFVLWTVLVRLVDIQSIGPLGSRVGLATVNGFWRDRIGVNMVLYTVTDWFGLIPLGVVMLFAAMGLNQWIGRKKLRRVDADILLLGGYYLVMLAAFAFFEIVQINYRPVLIEGRLETSYPSSTTILALSVMPVAALQVRSRVKKEWIRKTLCFSMTLFAAFMVIGRALSGVHWLTDIVGGILLSWGLVTLYSAVCDRIK